MRTLTRTFVSVSAVAGILVGGLAGTSVAVSATEVAAKPAAGVQIAAVDNHGLTTTEARYVQCELKANWGYSGALDGQLGTNSWKALQRALAKHWEYTGAIDGIPGPNTNKALQRLLMAGYGYPGPIDGIWGPNSIAAFKRLAAACAASC